MLKPVIPVDIKNKDLQKINGDPVATTKAIKLVYVNSNDEGIIRIKKGKGFIFKYQNKIIKSKAELHRIRSLVIPPAWTDVWICVIPEGHLQATGKDVNNRKQYRYHSLWNEVRSKTKFYNMLEVGKALPAIRKQIQKDIAMPGMSKNKVLAVVISLMEKTGIRVGNEFYEKLYGSFGLTTLKDKHVKIKGSDIRFDFRGKKGVQHQISLKSKKLANIIQHCRDIPGKELFQYIDEDGKRQSVESGMVNEYLRNIGGAEFSTKDLRTWCGSIAALNAFKEAGAFETGTEAKSKIVEVLDIVATQLGNTRTVCKKYYVHPSLPELYENGTLEDWLNTKKVNNSASALYPEEKAFINILKNL